MIINLQAYATLIVLLIVGMNSIKGYVQPIHMYYVKKPLASVSVVKNGDHKNILPWKLIRQICTYVCGCSREHHILNVPNNFKFSKIAHTRSVPDIVFCCAPDIYDTSFSYTIFSIPSCSLNNYLEKIIFCILKWCKVLLRL